MKFATLRNGSRDGELFIVSKDLKIACTAAHIAPTLQYALDHWGEVESELRRLYNLANENSMEGGISFSACTWESPLPRAYQWLDGSAYVNHVQLVRRARGADMPESFWTDPLMYQGGSDCFLGPHDDIPLQDINWGLDFEAEVVVVTGDVPMGATEKEAEEAILLVTLVNDISLRNLIPPELAKGFGFLQSKPASAFSPVAVTLDELGTAWDGSKLNLPLCTYLNNECFGAPEAGVDMTFGFPRLVAHAAKTRRLAAGTLLGSGTVSNKQHGVGYSCIAEKRMLEQIYTGHFETEFLKEGDKVKIEMKDEHGESIFGAIEQTVVSSASDKNN